MSLWALAFAAVQVIVHAVVLWRFGFLDPSAVTLIQIAAGFPAHAVTGFVLSLFFWPARNLAVRIMAMIPLALILFFNLFAFHYHAMFGTLPGWSVLTYLEEWATVRTSLRVEAPLGWFAGTLVFLCLALGALMWLLKRQSQKTGGTQRVLSYAAMTVMVLSLGLTLTAHLLPSASASPSLARSRIPVVEFLSSVGHRASVPSEAPGIDRETVFRLQSALGVPSPPGDVDPTCPLCAPSAGPMDLPGSRAGVIFLILESVGRQEISAQHQGISVMPALQALAEENLSFDRFYASGTQSCQSLPAMFSGIPAQPGTVLLWEKPLKRFEGFPSMLADRGYRTAFFHGGDLAFEQQRQYLEMAGFSEIHEYDPSLDLPVYGWGFSDGDMFDMLTSWIEAHRQERQDQPFLAALYTLTSHHPFELPEDWSSAFQGGGTETMFFESLRYLDARIEKFYRWYLEEEAPRGTVLVVTGDHAPLHANSEAMESGNRLRFDVPLIVALPGERGRPAALEALARRIGGHHDIPATVLDILELPPPRCGLGLPLLSDDAPWPADRFVYGVSGRELSQLYLWSDSGDGFVDALDPEGTAALFPDGGKDDLWDAHASGFVKDLQTVSRYLVTHDAFAPDSGGTEPRVPPLPRVETPIFAAHCGNTDGMQPLGKRNRLEAVMAAAKKGFEWVEIDVNITKERVPVLVHDAVVKDHDGQEHALAFLTLDQIRLFPKMKGIDTLKQVVEKAGDRVNLLVEAKPQESHVDESDLAREISRIVVERKGTKDVIVDSFSLSLAASVKKQCRCTVALDLPWSETLPEEWLRTAALTHLDWIYIHESMAAAGAVALAHRFGLKVMVFTVNDFDVIEALAPELPDGIITDHYGIVEKFRKVFLQEVKE